MIICGILEYFTSYIMEKLFNARWWDYSKQKFNINGRICLETLVLFGIAGVILTVYLNPIFTKWIELIPLNVFDILIAIFSTILFVDIIISFNVMNKIKNISADIGKEFKDNTEEISKRVRNAILEKSAIYRRVLEAFPQAFADKVKNSKEKIIQVATEVKDKTIENINAVKDKTIENVSAIKEKAIYGFKTIKEKATNRIRDIKTPNRRVRTIRYLINKKRLEYKLNHKKNN